jgi:N-acyl-D-amino-acid deacylase
MSEFDVVIKGGTVVDGTRAPRYIADVGVIGGRIAQIGKISQSSARKLIDASGCIVAPGFIDLHTHYDAQVFWDPYCSISSWHGVTSVVIGNCGFGFAPVAPELRERAMLTMTRVEAIPLASMQQGLPWDWETFPQFLDSVEATPKSVNLLPYVPVGPMLIDVLGFDDAKSGRMPTDGEHQRLQRMLDEAMDAGGCGWSAQRLLPSGPGSVQRDFDGTPMVTDVMHDETCFALAEVLGRRNDGFVQMTMVSGSAKRDAAHYEAIAQISNRPILFNVVIAFDERPKVHRDVLAWLDSCRERGLRVYGQGQTTDAGYTFTFEDWNLFDDSEAWREATTGSTAEKLSKLGDPARRPMLRDQLPVTVTEPIDKITVLGPRTAETKPFADLTVGEVAERLGKHPVDAILDIAVADGLKTLFYANPTNKSLEHLREIVDNEFVLFGVSDGGAHTKFLTAGRYPTETLTKVVREHEMISLEHAHWRLSALPAWCAGFRDRGTIVEGAAADIVVYDFDRLEALPSEVAYDLPGGEWRRVQRASGYRAVVVNGGVTIEGDAETGVPSGRLLRHGR